MEFSQMVMGTKDGEKRKMGFGLKVTNIGQMKGVGKMEEGKWVKIFWTDDAPEFARCGMFYRTMKLGQFIKEVEEKGYKIVGL